MYRLRSGDVNADKETEPVETWHSMGFETMNGMRTVFLDVAQELRLLKSSVCCDITSCSLLKVSPAFRMNMSPS
jgi:hypothetical protein